MSPSVMQTFINFLLNLSDQPRPALVSEYCVLHSKIKINCIKQN